MQQLCHDFEEASLPAHYRPMRLFIDRERLMPRDDAATAAIFAEARDTAATLGVTLRLPARRGVPRCDWPWRGAYVSYSGEAMPCCMVGTPDRASFGNVLGDGVAAVWTSEGYRRFRAALAHDRPPAVCSACALYRGTF